MPTPNSNWQKKVALALSVVVALAFLAAGGTKLAGLQFQVNNFIRWGYPQGFRYVTGLVEVGGAILLLIPKTRFVGALVILATMIGAIYTHVQAHEAQMAVPAAVFLLLSTFLAYFFRTRQ